MSIAPVLKISNATLIEHFARRNVDFSLSQKKYFSSYDKTVDSRWFSRHYCVLICRWDRVATTSLTRDIAVQSVRTVTRLDDFKFTQRWLLAEWTMCLRGIRINSVWLCGEGVAEGRRKGYHDSREYGIKFQTVIIRKRLAITRSIWYTNHIKSGMGYRLE